MKILNAGTRQITNNEVLQHINDLEAKYKAEGRERTVPESLKKMIRDVKSILALDPSTQQRTREPIPSPRVAKLASILSKPPYKLLSIEIEGIVNQIPLSRIELCLVVEEGEERFKEEELDEIVAFVEKYLGTTGEVKDVKVDDVEMVEEGDNAAEKES